MKKRRIGRGLQAQDVPEIPDRDVFQQAFSIYYGWSAPTYRWGDLNANQAYDTITFACTQRFPHVSIRDLEESRVILLNLGLLM